MENNELENSLEELENVVGKGEEPEQPTPDTDLDVLVKSIGNIKGKLNVNEKLVEGLRQIAEDNRAFGESIRELYKLIKDNNIELPEVLNVEVKNPVNEVEVKNLSDIKIPEPKDEIKITNLKEISDYKKDFLSLAQLMASINKLLGTEITVNMERYTNPNRPLSVRLSDGKKFYEAMVGAISMAGGTSFKNSAGESQLGLVDSSGHIQADILSMPSVTIDTTGLATSSKQDTQTTALEKIDDIQDAIKTRGATAGATDKGIPAMVKYESSDSHKTLDDGDYAMLSVNDFGELRTRDQRAIDLANCNSSTDYTVLGDDTTNLANSTNHVFGTGAIKFDKANGTANTVFAGVYKTFTAINLSEIFESGGFVGLGVYLPSLTNVVNVFLRIGTDASHYNCWTWAVADLTATTWLNLRKSASQPDASKNTGNGWNPATVGYVAFGVEFSGETNTLANMLFDHVHIVGGRVTASDISTAITSTVTTPNVNINRVGGVATATNSGVNGNGVLRVTVATDDEINNDLDDIRVAVEKLDDITGNLKGVGEVTVDTYQQVAINLNAGANQLLVSSSAGHQIWVYGFGFTVNVAGTVSFQDEDDTALSGVMNIGATSGMIVNPSGNFAMPIWKLATDKDLEVDVVTSELDGWLCYAIVNA